MTVAQSQSQGGTGSSEARFSHFNVVRGFVRFCVLILSLSSGVVEARPLEGFVNANGVTLQYLDYGGAGRPLILVHGLADDPHSFDDFAPALTKRFRVFAYARRGSGNSERRGPYDNSTLVEDLRGIMDSLGLASAALAGSSGGGNEITEMAARHPSRVSHLIYLDAGYDWSDPDFHNVFLGRPDFVRPESASASFDAFRSFERASSYPGIDAERFESYLRAKVTINVDGRVEERIPADVKAALYAALFTNPGRRYHAVRCPVLAIYAAHWFPVDVADPVRRAQAIQYDSQFAGFKAASINRLGRDISGAQIELVDGSHGNFLLRSRERVVDLVTRFLEQ
jgi:pimeloyl-ACP methyl ester carboxylesterase